MKHKLTETNIHPATSPPVLEDDDYIKFAIKTFILFKNPFPSS